MYVIRRVYATKPREARRAASLVAKIGQIYEDAGQRDPVKVYFNSGTTPGERNRVYMEWTAPVLESPYRGDNDLPDTGGYGPQLRVRNIANCDGGLQASALAEEILLEGDGHAGLCIQR